MPDSHDAHSKQAHADDQLIVRYFDGQLDASGVATLNDRLKAEPALRHRLIDLSLQMHYISALVGKPDLALVQDELFNLQPGRASLKFTLPMSYRIGFAAVSAAALALVVTLVIVLSGSESANPITNLTQSPDAAVTPDEPATRARAVATLTATHNARWSAGPASASLQTGDTLRSGQRLTLSAGFAEITTNRGAVAILQAPTTIELLDNNNAIHLHAGKLVGVCKTESSKGFTVFTDTAEVTDIGTVFGVELDAFDQTTVGVLSGHVLLTNKVSNAAPRLLKAGDITGVSADGLAISSPPHDAAQHFRAWGSLLRPVTVTGDAIFVQNMPAELHEDHEFVRVYRELGGVLLKEDLVVSRTEPGLYRPTDANERSAVPAGTRVDSYLVHINRPNRPTNRVTRTFTLAFDEPVVALIVHTELVIQTNMRLSNPGTRYLKAGGIGLVSKSGFASDAPQVDAIDWSDDRKTLRVTLNVEDADQFRVLTLSPQGVPEVGQNE